MNRIFNFSAGPAMLPLEVLERAQQELINYNSTGQSVMEMSHRSVDFEEILIQTQTLLTELLNIPSNYKILFLQGGASSQFAMVPMNLSKNKTADYVITGLWAKKAFTEGQKFTNARVIASSADKNFSYIPEISSNMINPSADYLHICLNNTIFGTCFKELPPCNNIPLVADASSCILSQQIDINKFGLIYSGAQKNLGIAGVTIVIIRDDLINSHLENIPTMFNYKIHSDKNSLYNTPPCYPIYICKLVLEWAKSMGGIEAIQKNNQEKADLLYDYLDKSSLFTPLADKKYRSITNVTFSTLDDNLDAKFISNCKNFNIVNIKGHRSNKGLRASIYNAMPIDGVKKLIDAMKNFEDSYKK